MGLPTFNGFSLNDDNFITERITFKGYASREVITGKINRREGVKTLASNYGAKEISIEGIVIADTPTELQTLLDNMKQNLTAEGAALTLETGRSFTATVRTLTIADAHYNQSIAPFEASFICSDPFAEGALLTVVIPVPSGRYTISGSISISGSMYNRPTFVYTPPAGAGQTLLTQLDIYHTPTGQRVTVSGFGSGTNLNYNTTVTINFDDFTASEGSTEINNSGSFPRWDPGTNEFTFNSTGRAFPGGSLTISYQPRYL